MYKFAGAAMLGVAAAKDFKAIFNSGMENAISPISD
jgi:hypothetical protein